MEACILCNENEAVINTCYCAVCIDSLEQELQEFKSVGQMTDEEIWAHFGFDLEYQI